MSINKLAQLRKTARRITIAEQMEANLQVFEGLDDDEEQEAKDD